MGVVPGALFGVGEDLVGVAELLELGVGVGLGDAGGDELVGVALEGEFTVRRLDFIGGAAAVETQDLVVAPPLHPWDFALCLLINPS